MKKVLLIDDSQSNIALLTDILEGNGYEVLSANNPQHGMLVFESNPDLHAVICDYDLGNFQYGDEVIGKIKTQNPNMPCILISHALVKEKARAVKAIFIWRKSSNLEELVLGELELM